MKLDLLQGSAAFEKAVVRLEDKWVDAGEGRNDVIDYAIFKSVLEVLRVDKQITLVHMPIQPTVFLPEGWQSGGAATPLSVGGLRRGGVCLSQKCIDLLRSAIAKCVRESVATGRRSATVLAYDAAQPTSRRTNVILPNQGHVHCITCTRDAEGDGWAIHAIEPTHEAVWHGSLSGIMQRHVPSCCRQISREAGVGVQYRGMVFGLPIDHGNLCRYKVAVDGACAPLPATRALLPAPPDALAFRRIVATSLAKLLEDM